MTITHAAYLYMQALWVVWPVGLTGAAEVDDRGST
jgi:hypothetical protein